MKKMLIGMLMLLFAVSANAGTAFLGGNLLDAANWDSGSPGAGNDGTINVNGSYSGLNQNNGWMSGSTVTVGGGATLTLANDLAIKGGIMIVNDATINCNDDLFVDGGILILNAGSVTTSNDDWEANNVAGRITVYGGIHNSGTGTGHNVGAQGGSTKIGCGIDFRGGTVTAGNFRFQLNSISSVGGSAILASHSATTTFSDMTGAIDFLLDWTGSWEVGSYGTGAWATALTTGGFTLNGAAIDAASFASNFTVSVDGTTLTLTNPIIPVANPNPENTATDVPVNATLSWTTAIDPLTGVARTDVVNHLVYLSAPNDPNLTTVTAVPVADTGTGFASYPAAPLSRDAVYTWRVDEQLTDTSVITGPVWSFETVPSTPVVTTQPAVDTLVDAGTAVDLTVEALNPFTSDDTGMTYQWSHDGSPVGTGITLSIPSAQIADEGEYDCVVTITANGATAQSDSGWVNVKRTVQYHAFDGDLTDTIGVNDGVYTNVDPNLVTPTFDTGFAGSAISLNGREFVNIGTAGYPRAKSSLEHGTVACWVKTVTGGQIIGAANDQPQYYTTVFEFEVASTGGLRSYIRDEAGNTSVVRTSGTANDDAWHYVVVAWNASPAGGELTLYIDGASQGTSTSGGSFETFGDWVYDLVIGARNNRGTIDDFMTGLIDELKVYNYALTADDVAVAYEGYTGLDTCVHPPALDFTGPEDTPDCIVDMYDFAYFASSWLECGLVPECL